MSSTRRISLTIPSDLVADLDDISTRLGCSRSASVTGLLANSLPALRAFVDSLPDDLVRPDGVEEGAGRRLRGASGAVLRDQLDNIRGMLDTVSDPSDFALEPCSDRPAGCSCDYSSSVRVAPAGGCLVHRG